MSDLIDKDDAINAFTEWASENLIPHKYETWYTEGVKMFKNVPSAEPEKRTNKRTETHECDLISRKDAIDALSCENPTEMYIYYDDAVKAIKEVPPAQPERTGRWIVIPSPDTYHCGLVKCPYCQEELIAEPNEYNYCPNCGARMEVERDYDYERASDMRDYCERYEPTYNPDDGSM